MDEAPFVQQGVQGVCQGVHRHGNGAGHFNGGQRPDGHGLEDALADFLLRGRVVFRVVAQG